jgi:hypothetical protein
MQSSGPAIGASLAGNRHPDNEDTWGSAGDLAWVLDGASRPPHASAAESATAFVARVSTELTRFGGSDQPLPAIVKQVIRAVATDDVFTPAATLALARRRGDQLEWLLLGDASIFIETGDSVIHLTDSRLATVAVAERAAWAASDGDDRDERWLALFDAEQELRNTAGGYWVLADVESAADHAITGTATVTGDVVLATDGVTDALGPAYDTPADLLDELTWSGPERFLMLLHEQLPVAGRQRIDDATVVLLRA